MLLDAFIESVPSLCLRSDRLLCRALTEADVPQAIAHEQDRRIMQWIRDPVPVEEIEERVRACLEPWDGADGRWLILALERISDAAWLGILCLRVTDRSQQTMEIGYRLHSDFHRQGFAFEACQALIAHLFEVVAVRRLCAYCAVENEASWRLMEKLSMQREARLREYAYLDGAWRDEFIYGLLRREYAGDSR